VVGNVLNQQFNKIKKIQIKGEKIMKENIENQNISEDRRRNDSHTSPVIDLLKQIISSVYYSQEYITKESISKALNIDMETINDIEKLESPRITSDDILKNKLYVKYSPITKETLYPSYAVHLLKQVLTSECYIQGCITKQTISEMLEIDIETIDDVEATEIKKVRLLEEGKEIWEPIEMHPEYAVSNLGRVKIISEDINITKDSDLLHPSINEDGHYEVILYKKVKNDQKAYISLILGEVLNTFTLPMLETIVGPLPELIYKKRRLTSENNTEIDTEEDNDKTMDRALNANIPLDGIIEIEQGKYITVQFLIEENIRLKKELKESQQWAKELESLMTVNDNILFNIEQMIKEMRIPD